MKRKDVKAGHISVCYPGEEEGDEGRATATSSLVFAPQVIV